jgi:aminoglycoside phosphotransferase family enzyme
MIISFPVRKEEHIKTKKYRVLRIIQFVTYFINIVLFCMISISLLFLKYRPKTKIFGRNFRNLQKFHPIIPLIRPESVISRIVSPTTQVVFTESRLAERSICVKIWQRQRIKKDIREHIPYLLEGFIYNQRFAPRVYLGIMYFEKLSEDTQTFLPGRLALVPRKSKLAKGRYAYLMKTLPIDWRLDSRLYSAKEHLATNEGMKLLAREVADLHRRAGISFTKSGLPVSLAEKLKFNQHFFAQILEKLSQDGIDIHAYNYIGSVMEIAVRDLELDFQRRLDQRRIKRCHGDLKLTNIFWPTSERGPQQHLLAIDCIDFNPDFCNIDTLSDVAMLIIDLQMHLTLKDSYLVDVFIATYLQEMAEDAVSIKRVLKYYSTEKAIVCANVSILLDSDPERGIKYLSLALLQATELQRMLPSSANQRVNVVEEEIVKSAESIIIR